MFALLIIPLTAFSQLQYPEKNVYGGYVKRIVENHNGDMFVLTGNGLYYRKYGSAKYEDISPDEYPVYTYGLALMNDTLFLSTEFGFYLSSDFGKSWELITNDLRPCQLIEINKTGEVFAVKFDKDKKDRVYRITDCGKSWKAVYTEKSFTGIDRIAVDSDGNWYIGDSKEGIFKSENKGNSWEKIHSGYVPTYHGDVPVFIESVFITRDDLIFTGTRGKAYFFSTDKGDSWIYPLDTNMGVYINKFCEGESGNVFAVWQQRERVIDNIVTKNAIIKMKDGGRKWEKHTTPITADNVHVMFVDENDCLLAGYDEFGVIKSADTGKSWIDDSDGINAVDISNILNTGNDLIACSGESGIFLSADNGNTWNQTGGLTYRSADMVCDNNGIVYAMQATDSYLKSTDNGKNWQEIDIADFRKYGRNYSIGYDKVNDILYIGGNYDYLYSSTNGGVDWKPTHSFGCDWVFIDDITCNSKGYVYAGDTFGRVFLSKDTGNTWIRLHEYYFFGGIKNIRILDNDRILMTTWMGLYSSDDHGFTWSLETKGLGDTLLYFLASDDGIVYGASQNCGIFYSCDNGSSWSKLVDSIPQGVSALEVAPDGKIIIGTFGKGILLFDPKPVGNAKPNDRLFDVYPNPTAGELNITFEKWILEKMELTLFDLMGITVYEKKYCCASPGIPPIPIGGLAPGVYFLRVRSGSRVAVRKVVVAR